MRFKMSNYWKWLKHQGREIDIETVMKNVWDWVNGDQKERIEIIYYVLVFFRLIKLPQFQMLEDVMKKADMGSLEEVYLSIASALLVRMQAFKENLAEFRSTHDPGEFSRYLFTTMRNVSRHCVTEIIRMYYDPKQILADAAGGVSHRHISFSPSTSSSRQSLTEIIVNIAIQKEAQGIAEQIMQYWNDAQRNALCHYLETISGHKSARLSKESKVNIYQIHHRIKEKLLQMFIDRDSEQEVCRAFCRIYKQEICQKTPVLSIYKDRGDS